MAKSTRKPRPETSVPAKPIEAKPPAPVTEVKRKPIRDWM